MLPGTNIRKIRNRPNLPNIIARQKNVIYSMHNLFCVYIYIYIYMYGYIYVYIFLFLWGEGE